MPMEQYESVDAASKHMLDALAISPLHCWTYYRNPDRIKAKDTPAKLIGSAIHVSILEPDRFEKEYIKEPSKHEAQEGVSLKILDLLEDYKLECRSLGLPISGTKAQLYERLPPNYIAWDRLYESLTEGKKVLSVSDWYVVKAITARVRKHPSASYMLSEGSAEQSVVWTDRETGVKCKGRIDWISNVSHAIIDLKSTTDASPQGFQRSITKYRYYVQAAMYVDGLKELRGDYPFIFAAWEKSSPYASALYYATADMLEAGRKEYRRLLKIYAECLDKNKWPGYSDKVEPIGLPENFKAESTEPEMDWLDEMANGIA